jgi:hypothetical protein
MEVRLMKNSILTEIRTHYRPVDIAEAILMGVIYYVLIGGIVLAPIITISSFLVPYIIYILTLIFIVLSFVGYYAITKTTETLSHIKATTLSFDSLHKYASIILAIVTFIVLAVIYFLYLR